MTEWNIRSRAHSCHNCRRDFADGETCFSVVADLNTTELPDALKENLPSNQAAQDAKPPKTPGSNNSEYVRVDLCKDCKKAIADVSWVSEWQSVYTPPAPPAPEPLPRETAETLLRKLVESEGSHENTAVIFVLAVMLERKKILIERTVRPSTDGTLLRVYEHKKSGEVMFITDPNLQPEEIPFVQQKISELLAPPPPEPEPEPDVNETAPESTTPVTPS